VDDGHLCRLKIIQSHGQLEAAPRREGGADGRPECYAQIAGRACAFRGVALCAGQLAHRGQPLWSLERACELYGHDG